MMIQPVGVVRGCGEQKIGASVNLAAYYLVGIPAAAVFAFICHLEGMVFVFLLHCLGNMLCLCF